MSSSSRDRITIHGARQNNLRNLTVSIPTRQLVVVTGVSGSGKSSLVFDTLYAEGQRRYVETFSPYARQFLDRMDKPQVDRIDGIPPAIAIDQTNPVRTSRSTVGTMTELNDHLKLLFARAGRLHCRCCARPVRRDTPESIVDDLAQRTQGAGGDPRLVVTFPVPIPDNFDEDEVLKLLEAQGYTRVHARTERTLHIVQDRFRFGTAERARITEAIEGALRVGRGRVDVHALADADAADGTPAPAPWRWSTGLHCAFCDIAYDDPVPSLFSFNSPLGACETCRGFGRVIDIDFGLVIPDESRTLGGGAVKPWQTPSFAECQGDMVKFAKLRGVPLDVPFAKLSDAHRHWVLEGEPAWESWDKSWPGTWYGVRHFFKWLESKSYKMHIRVLLSKYRAYTACTTCDGARLKPAALTWRIGGHDDADSVLPRAQRFLPRGVAWDRPLLESLPGLSIHDVMLLPADRGRAFFDRIAPQAARGDAARDEAADLLFAEIRTRLAYLADVGLGYLTLDRQSRTLSGGEVQRINLTTALGTSLVNTLFVLDEPSIGLHPRDMHRVVGLMHRLRDAGNTLVVVEHDPAVMLAADRILDIGPGPGERGGAIVFDGTPDALRHAPATLTAEYLAGRRRADAGLVGKPVAPDGPAIVLTHVTANNLKDITVRFPLEALVVVTGVSGSGKSTLVQDVLWPALQKRKGRPAEMPGAFGTLSGDRLVGDVVFVDQTPIGKTTRSNPASYVGAFDALRRRFADAPLARERGWTPGTFSFNSGDGRCPTCGGNGFEHVEMQFLSDVYLRCPDCDGKRYRPEVLEVTIDGRSMADVLELTVSEAVRAFATDDDVLARLVPLVNVGLEYVRLGQPVPTLSGGEAQRLKLAGHLAEAAAGNTASTLFLFDEPTTGLHFDDVAKLLRAFRELIARGHSLIVIEHNLDVIRAADWLIDLGPEGGDAGGEIVVEGSVDTVRACRASHTGAALIDYDRALAVGFAPKPDNTAVLEAAEAPGGRYLGNVRGGFGAIAHDAITVRNAREHNLKGVDVEIPHDGFTVITGVSGSGKSTLAFDILFNEGQRRYLESLNAYARQFVQPASRPDVDAIFGIPPTVAIEQRTSRGGRKSTVATLTELYHFLRLLWMKLGVQHCPNDGTPIAPQSADSIAAQLLREHRGKHIGLLAPLVIARKGYYTDLADWAKGKGFEQLRVDGTFVSTLKWPRLDRFKEHTIELPVADLVVSPDNEAPLRRALATALEHGKGVVHVVGPLDGLMEGRARLTETVFSTKRACPTCNTSYPELDPRLFSFNSPHGWCRTCFGTGAKLADFDAEQTGEEAQWLEPSATDPEATVCPACQGSRLNPVARHVRFRDRGLADLVALPVRDVDAFFAQLVLEGRERDIARDLLAELRSRLAFLQDVGLGYLALDRSAPTLSGGEAQRIRLAAQLGSNLQGVCYVLDEPTIGLHPRDNRVLLDTLGRLEAKGNTLVVVEHDEDTIRRADHVIDLGPGAGTRGGRVIAAGTAAMLAAQPDSITGRFLAQPLRHPLRPRRAVRDNSLALHVRHATLHNLKGVSARVPLGRLTVVTGVSGSGKSTFARDVLRDNLARLVSEGRRKRSAALVGCEDIGGAERIGRVLEVDQTPIGKTPRSCPATYVGFWDAIRKLFAATPESRMRGWGPGRFSFNTPGGRCEACEGQGVQRIEMSFLPDVQVVCDACAGQRFNPDTLSVRYKDRSIGDVLQMSIDDAVKFFETHSAIHHTLQLLQDVGLGYLTLGQQSPTLSGGEAQRIKLVTELARVKLEPELPPPVDTKASQKRARAAAKAAAAAGPSTTTSAPAPKRPDPAEGKPGTLYVLDEPTVGLHMADVEKLIHVLHRLVDGGNTVVVIEHNLDVMAEADWIVDLGPEGGSGGGEIVAIGAPEVIAAAPGRSHTAQVLGGFLRERGK
jgi:excinuclease ABC subunit A